MDSATGPRTGHAQVQLRQSRKKTEERGAEVYLGGRTLAQFNLWLVRCLVAPGTISSRRTSCAVHPAGSKMGVQNDPRFGPGVGAFWRGMKHSRDLYHPLKF